MSKTDKELAAEILQAAIAAGQVRTTSNTSTGQGDDMGSAFKRIYEAVSQELPPGP
jgi:methyl-accepting chemotaxis protein